MKKKNLSELSKSNMTLTMEMCYAYTQYYKLNNNNNNNNIIMNTNNIFHAHEYDKDDDYNYWFVLTRNLEFIDIGIPQNITKSDMIPPDYNEMIIDIIKTILKL